jgi:hypothetical protein
MKDEPRIESTDASDASPAEPMTDQHPPEAPGTNAEPQPGAPSPDAVRKGRRAAIALFAVCAALQVAITAAARAQGRSEEQLNVLFLDLFLVVLGARRRRHHPPGAPQAVAGGFLDDGPAVHLPHLPALGRHVQPDVTLTRGEVER